MFNFQNPNHPPTDRQDLDIARQAINAGDLPHACHHLSAVLSHHPHQPEALALLHHAIDLAPDPVALVPRQQHMWYAEVATLAYILQHTGRPAEALRLIANVVAMPEGMIYLVWVAEWITPPLEPRGLTVDHLLPLVLAFARGIPDDPMPADHPARPHLEHVVPTLLELGHAHPDQARYVGLTAILLRKLGRADDAIAIAEAAFQTRPTQLVAAVLAKTHQKQGDVDAALRVYRDGLALGSDEANLDTELRLDHADLLRNIGRFDAALQMYETVIARQPGHPWATPNRLYLQYVLTGATHWKEQLLAYASTQATNGSQDIAATLAERAGREAQPFVNVLPLAYEAIIGIAEHIPIPEPGTPRQKLELPVGVSALEAPSARLALQRHLAQHYDPVLLEIVVADLQTPDPREPHGAVDVVLWVYEGTDPRPNVAPPADNVALAVALLASRPFQIDRWEWQARQIAATLGPGALDDLLGVMVHPPEGPEGMPFWDWLHYVQIAAALIIAVLDDGAWDESPRKRALFSLARGPLDWTVEAAIIVLARVAERDPRACAEIIDLFADLLDHLPDFGACPYALALGICPLRVPDVPGALRQRFLELARTTMESLD